MITKTVAIDRLRIADELVMGVSVVSTAHCLTAPSDKGLEVIPRPVVDFVICRCGSGLSAGLGGISPQQEIRLPFISGDSKLQRDASGEVSMLSANDDDLINAANFCADSCFPVAGTTGL